MKLPRRIHALYRIVNVICTYHISLLQNSGCCGSTMLVFRLEIVNCWLLHISDLLGMRFEIFLGGSGCGFWFETHYVNSGCISKKMLSPNTCPDSTGWFCRTLLTPENLIASLQNQSQYSKEFGRAWALVAQNAEWMIKKQFQASGFATFFGSPVFRDDGWWMNSYFLGETT